MGTIKLYTVSSQQISLQGKHYNKIIQMEKRIRIFIALLFTAAGEKGTSPSAEQQGLRQTAYVGNIMEY